MSGTWEEVTVARRENRRELVLSGKIFSERIARSGLDPSIFLLTNLNFLEISNASVITISSDLGNLVNLTDLVLKNNCLDSLPDSINNLVKLKLLDVSMNKINHLPNMDQLSQLATLNLSINQISGEFPNCGLSSCSRLATLDVSVNQLTGIGEISTSIMEYLAEVMANKNQITSISPDIAKNWPVIKKLDLSENSLKTVPGELADCVKLKEVNLTVNPLSDNRLKKMAAQKGTKSVMDYIRQNCQRGGTSVNTAEGKSGSKKSKKSKTKETKADQENTDIVCDSLSVMSLQDGNPVVVVDSKVKDIRQYIVCCVVRDIHLSGENLRKFIKLQTQLHASVCEKRTAATIATHDLDLVKGPKIYYTALAPEDVHIVPLGGNKSVRSDKLVQHLHNEAEAARKDKKRSQVSGLHQYLHMLDRVPLYACLKDNDGNTISFPPVTNSNNTKICAETKNILIEVTSNVKLATAKMVADQLLMEMLKLGLGEGEEEVKGVAEGELKQLKVEQMKIVDEDGNLKVIYPSKTDLVFEGVKNIVVERK